MANQANYSQEKIVVILFSGTKQKKISKTKLDPKKLLKIN